MRRSLWMLLALVPAPAVAHPVDEIVQGAYLTLAPGEVRLELDLTPGSEVAGALLRELDANSDARISRAEMLAYGWRVLRQSTLTLDGAVVPWRLQQIRAPSYQNIRTAAATLKIFAVAVRPERAAPHTLVYLNRYRPAKSQCIANVFLLPGAGWQYRALSQKHDKEGRQLSVAYLVATE